MSYAYYERLSIADVGMLAVEDENAHMHMGGVSIFEPGPLWEEESGLDIGAIEDHVSSRLHRIPRYRQRLEYSPLDGYPIWVDDPRFNIHYHVRHTCLPRPASERQLKRLVGRILSQQLDRGKPLWEMWFVEGLEDGRFAMISKIHHCMMDGMAGVGIFDELLRGDADTRIEPAHPWLARNRPTGRRMFVDSLLRRPLAVLRDGAAALREPRKSLRHALDGVAGIAETALANRRLASATPLNAEIGPHRRFDWSEMRLADIKEVKDRLGGTVNDVVMSVAAGALGGFLDGRGVDIHGLDFRAAIPVSTWTDADVAGDLGNRTSFLTAPLPIDEASPTARLKQVSATMRERKRSRMALGQRALAKISEWTSPGLYTGLTRLGGRIRAFNVVISNIPGPQKPAYFLGSRQLKVIPAIPNFANQLLTIGIFSYDGCLFWGFNADWDAVPDLHDLVEAVDEQFERLRKEAAGAPVSDAKRRARPAAKKRKKPAPENVPARG